MHRRYRPVLDEFMKRIKLKLNNIKGEFIVLVYEFNTKSLLALI